MGLSSPTAFALGIDTIMQFDFMNLGYSSDILWSTEYSKIPIGGTWNKLNMVYWYKHFRPDMNIYSIFCEEKFGRSKSLPLQIDQVLEMIRLKQTSFSASPSTKSCKGCLIRPGRMSRGCTQALTLSKSSW